MRTTFKTLLVALIISASSFSYGQTEFLNNYVKAGVGDAEKLFEAYLSPFGKSLSNGLNAGWYNTAKPHSLLGFDVTFTANIVQIPDVDKLFNANELGMEHLTVTGPKTSPTVFGEAIDGQTLSINAVEPVTNTPVSLGSFTSPQGVNVPVVPVPTAKIALGLIKDTEVMARFIPKTPIADVADISLWGVGVKHSLKQWIPGGKLIPFQLSLLVAYTQSNNSVSINADDPDQHVVLNTSSLNTSLLVSKKLLMLTIYGGVGYSQANTKLALKGEYQIPQAEGTQLTSVLQTVTDPFDLNFPDNNVIMTAGLRVKIFAVVALHADFTYANYPIYSVGAGVNFR